MKKNRKLKKGLIVTTIISASMFNTPALISDAMAKAIEDDSNNQSKLTDTNNSTTNNGDSESSNTSTNNDKNINTDINNDETLPADTTTTATTDSKTPVKQDKSMGPGYYESAPQSLMKATSLAVPTANTSTFLNSVVPGAIEGWNKYKVLPSVTIAQSIIESGWGESLLATSAHNLFGIKGRYNGQYVVMRTREEDSNGNSYYVNAEFRKYPSNKESIDDHGYFLVSNPRYHNLLGVTNYKTVTALLKQDGYATANDYPQVLNNIIEQYGLTKYDNQAINVNKGDQDSFKVTDTSIKARGWHVSSKSEGRPYSYLFLMDANTNREIKRIRINRQSRTDVNKVYPYVDNSSKSGYENSFETGGLLGRKVYVMSRYSSDPKGDQDSVDYKYDNHVLTLPTKASVIESASADGKSIHAKGWQIDNNSEGKQYSYAFLMDNTTGREVARQKITRITRNDVASKYPEIKNSKNSGFDVKFPVNESMRGHSYKIIIRYTNDAAGDGAQVADARFDKVFSVPAWKKGNIGDQDSLTTSGNTIKTRGWHVSSESKNKPYSYLFLMDADTNREVKRIKIDRTTRTDVNNVYPDFVNSEKSGFEQSFQITDEMRGKKLYVMSRYSSDPKGDLNSVDYKYTKNVISIPGFQEGNTGDQDSLAISGSTIKTRGWHVSSDSKGKNYSYLFVMNAKNNREIKRIKIDRKKRDDVNNIYPNIINSELSGYENTIDITDEMRGKQIYIMSRYSSDPKGDKDSVDYRYTRNKLSIPEWKTGNVGDQDSLTMSGDTIKARGWHVNSDSDKKPYSYLFLMDANTNREIKRIKIDRQKRTDVNNVYSNMKNSLMSGYDNSFTVTNDMRGKKVYIMSRYSSDPKGDKGSVDYKYSKNVLTIK